MLDTQALENEFDTLGGNFSQNLEIVTKHTNEGVTSPAFPMQLENEFDAPNEVSSQYLDEVAVSPVFRLVLDNEFDTPGE